MANVNEVATADGEVIMSVIDDTVTEEALLEGYTATASDGSKITGKLTVSNPNLIINPDFSINQRGQMEYSGVGYTVDGWLNGQSTTMFTVMDDNVKLGYIPDSSPTGPAVIVQRIENPERFDSKTVTASVYVEETTSVQPQLLIRYNTEDETTNYIQTNLTIGNNSVTGDIPEGISKLEFWLYGADIRVSGDTLDSYTIFKRLKLELGSVATPDPPTNKALETLKCQRYLQFHTTGDIDPVDLRPTMRITPTVTQMDDGRWMYNAEL